MAICKLEDLAAVLPEDGRLMGLDLGEKTIGVAVSDAGRRIATPYDTIQRRKFTVDVQTLIAWIDTREALALVVGLPINMDGSEGPRCQSVREFAYNFLRIRDLPIAFWDERLSTMAVERAMIAADMSRRKRRERIDASAAAYILQGALDALGRSGMVAAPFR